MGISTEHLLGLHRILGILDSFPPVSHCSLKMLKLKPRQSWLIPFYCNSASLGSFSSSLAAKAEKMGGWVEQNERFVGR